ncbi:MAG: hypothetical protein EBX52_00880, partial [Proteobacteria bacterium]|nr:hypothetical protein [Pseudomonadota bacterium]
METVGRTLKGVFGFSRSGDFPKLWANRPSGFLRYALHRNRGYFQRRFLNFANELVEIGCLALVFNPGLLRSLVLIPLTHILINYLSEYHWQLYRTIPDSWREKKVNPIDIGLWVLAGALMAGTGGWIFTRNDRDPVLLGLVAIRFVAVVLQLGLAPRIARLTSLKRVRPNIPLIWGGAFSVWILALLPAIGSPAYWYGFWVTGWFNFNKIVQEWSYFRRVEEEKRRQRLILPRSINREHTRRHFYFVLAMVVLHLGLIGAFCYHFKLEHSRLSPLVVFFVASFLDRLNGRPVRSLALDFDELRRRRLRLLGRGMVRRVLLISGVLVCLSEGYLLMHRNLSGLAIFGLAYVAIQGVVNQIWIYASIGADQRQGTHPVAKVLAFQMFAVAALFLTGPAGAWAFVAGAV